jgi:hypothetical protein
MDWNISIDRLCLSDSSRPRQAQSQSRVKVNAEWFEGRSPPPQMLSQFQLIISWLVVVNFS